MDTKDFRRVALNPYYEFSVEVPLSRYGVCFEDYRKAFQAGFRTAHRYWDGIEDDFISAVELRPRTASKGRTSVSRTGFSTPKVRCMGAMKSRSNERERMPA